MRRALAVPALTAIFALVFVVLGFAQPSQTPGLDPALNPALVGQAPADLPAQVPVIPEPPAGTKAPSNIDTPPAFTHQPEARPHRTRPDLTFAQKPAPVDFRGLLWGADLTSQTGLVPVTKPLPLPGTYFRTDELLRLGQAELRSVAYYFPKGKLTGVGIVFEGQDNFFLLKDHLIEHYGPGRQMGDRYGWTWSNFFIELRMRENQGSLRFATQP